MTIYHHDSEPKPIVGLNHLSHCERINDAFSYFDYLELMARHKLVIGFGKNFFGGEIMDDALLTNTVYAGGDGENFLEEHLYAEIVISGSHVDNAVRRGIAILSDNKELVRTVDYARMMGEQHLSFAAGGHCLSDFVATLVA